MLLDLGKFLSIFVRKVKQEKGREAERERREEKRDMERLCLSRFRVYFLC